MQPSVVLILYLATLYVLTIMIFLHCLRGRKTDVFMMTAPRTDVPLVLQQGQTIIGVRDTTERICFCIGEIEEHVHDEDTIE